MITPPRIWVVLRVFDGEAPRCRSVHTSPNAADKAAAFEDSQARSLVGFEGCRHKVVEYVPASGERAT